jgi:hypothetical protein
MLAPVAALLFRAAMPLAPGGVVSGSVTAESGVEYDSNANRAQIDDAAMTAEPPRGGPLLRGLSSGQLSYAGGKQRLRLQLQAGGKLFLLPSLQDQNIGVIAGTYEHAAQLTKVRVGAAVDYYDAYQAPAMLQEKRDFRSLTAAFRLTGGRPVGESRLHRVDGGLDLGGQLFMFKPDSSYSFLAPSLLGRLTTTLHAGDPELGHDFDLGVHARIDYRGYMYGRTDVFVQSGASFTWQGPLLLQVGYTVQLSLSTIDGESYQRHLVLAKLGFRIPGDFYVTAKAQMNLLQGAPGLFVPVSNIDDDNRSLALLDIERPLPRGFALLLRYAGYFSLPRESGPSYERHTAYLGASYSWKAKSP